MVVVFYIGLANDLRLCKFQFMVAGPDRRDFAHKTCETFSLRTVLPCYRTLVLSLSLSLSSCLLATSTVVTKFDLCASRLSVAASSLVSLRVAELRYDSEHRRCSRGLDLIPRVFPPFWCYSSKTENFVGGCYSSSVHYGRVPL